jgi:hypothetical protein
MILSWQLSQMPWLISLSDSLLPSALPMSCLHQAHMSFMALSLIHKAR